MKKVLSFVLASSLVLGSFSVAFADTTSKGLNDLSGKNCELQATALVDLGVIAGYPDGTFGPEKDVTRAQMAAMILQGLGLKESSMTNTFPDAKNHWAKGWVGLAQNLGIITGYPDGTFKPDNNVTYNEAMAMLIKALGYNENSLTGTWPGNYATKAQRLGITEDVTTTGGNALRGDIAIMLFNTLEQELGMTNKDGKFESDKTTMLDSLGAKVDEDFRIIKDTDEGYIDLYSFLGKSVKAYTIKKGNNKDKIVAIKEVESTTLVGEVKSATKFESDDVTYYYTDGASTYVPFTNGVALGATNGAIADMKGEVRLEVKLSGKSIDKIYSVSKWEGESFKYDTDMLDEADFNSYTLPTLVDGKTVVTSKFQLLGAESLEKIKNDSIVTVYVANDLITKIEVSTDTATGKVTQISSDGKYTIGGKVYELASNPVPSTPQINEEGTARLDYAGNIAEWKVSEAAKGNYAILLAAQEGKGSLETNRVKLVTKDGKEVVFDVKDAAAFEKVSGAALGTFLEYATNKDGKITEINVWDLKDFDGKVSASGSLIGTKPVDANAVVFMYKTADEYDVVKVSDLQKDNALTTEAAVRLGYYIPAGESKIKALVVTKKDTTKTNTIWAVINQIDTKVNGDDEAVDYLIGLANGKAFTAYTDSKGMFTGFDNKTGLVELSVDANGVVTAKATTIDAKSTLTDVTVEKIEGNLLNIGNGVWVPADAKVVVYAYNDEKEVYETKTLSFLKGKTVNMYQVDKDSELYDIIVVQKDVQPEVEDEA